MFRSNAIATRYKFERFIRSHFMSGRITNPCVEELSLTSTLSASDTPVRMFSTLKCKLSEYILANLLEVVRTIASATGEKRRYKVSLLYHIYLASL